MITKKKKFKRCPKCKEICIVGKKGVTACWKCKFNFKPIKKPPTKLPYLENYQAYLKSPHWKQTRKKFFEKNDYECKACGSSDNLNLHHATYRRMGVEEEGDLVALCQECHHKVHELQKHSKEDLYEVTYYYIDQMRQVNEFADIIRERNLFPTP